MELGELVSFYRRQAGLTIDELADKSGVPKSTINKIIGGTTKAPTLENVKAIAKALGVRLADFDSEPELADMFSVTEQDIIKKYRLLDPYGKEAVDGVLDVEYRRCGAEKTASSQEPMVQMEAAEEISVSIPEGQLNDEEKVFMNYVKQLNHGQQEMVLEYLQQLRAKQQALPTASTQAASGGSTLKSDILK